MSFSQYFVIHHEKLDLYLAISEVSSLYLHEEVISKALSKLVNAIKTDGIVRHPIIVDMRSSVVLDGMHRVAAVESLGCKRLPVCLVDYANDSIKVGCWYRTVKEEDAFEKAKTIVSRLGLSLEKVAEIQKDRLGASPVVGALTDSENSFFIKHQFKDKKEAYDVIKAIEESAKQSGLTVEHETEFDAQTKLENKSVGVVLLTPKLTKEDIVQTALSGRVYAYKATRHIIPARPLNVNVPLQMLCNSEKPLTELNGALKTMLEKRHLTKITSGSIFDGRRYEEDTYIFEQE